MRAGTGCQLDVRSSVRRDGDRVTEGVREAMLSSRLRHAQLVLGCRHHSRYTKSISANDDSNLELV